MSGEIDLIDLPIEIVEEEIKKPETKIGFVTSNPYLIGKFAVPMDTTTLKPLKHGPFHSPNIPKRPKLKYDEIFNDLLKDAKETLKETKENMNKTKKDMEEIKEDLNKIRNRK